MTASLPSRWLITTPDYANDPDIFPLLPGFSFIASKRPQWSTAIAAATSDRERRRKLWSYPRWNFKVAYEVLRDSPSTADLQKLFAFFNAHAGMYGEFFFFDPSDNAVSAQRFGTGDGSTHTFQLIRTVGSGNLTFAEPVFGVCGTPTVTVNGASTGSFTIGAAGIITFASAPAAGAPLAWTGQFMFLCRFDQDDLDTQQMMQGLWSQSGLAFRTVKQ